MIGNIIRDFEVCINQLFCHSLRTNSNCSFMIFDFLHPLVCMGTSIPVYFLQLNCLRFFGLLLGVHTRVSVNGTLGFKGISLLQTSNLP